MRGPRAPAAETDFPLNTRAPVGSERVLRCSFCECPLIVLQSPLVFLDQGSEHPIEVRVSRNLPGRAISTCRQQIVQQRFDVFEVSDPVYTEDDEVIPAPSVAVSRVQAYPAKEIPSEAPREITWAYTILVRTPRCAKSSRTERMS